jgi:hypothetical protein
MTIPTLLRHLGIDVPRFVTVDGQIVTDGVERTVTGATHIAHGSVTPLVQHTFHGGADPYLAPTRTNWWDDGDALNPHREAMALAFPSFEYSSPREMQPPAWFGVINTGRGRFKVGVFLRRDEGLPSIRVFGPQLGAHSSGRWVRSPHLYDSGYLCVADQADWNSATHTAATATAWAAHWLAAYTEWRMSRLWPAEGVRHAVDKG